ncbi:uncharacterized protein [Ptychodera flava]|uniref:uncharacterized protein n=1 Tax=Ptychodera flava TaxID=63121 RepID=UPI00396A8E18
MLSLRLASIFVILVFSERCLVSSTSSSSHLQQDRSNEKQVQRTVLIVNDEWGTAKGGISTVNRQIASILVQAGFDVYVTALQADEADHKNAKEAGITKILTPEVGRYIRDKTPDLDWLKLHRHFFSYLRQEIPELSFIIGHAPITHYAALSMREDVFPEAESVFFNHIIPEDTETYKETGTPQRVEQKESDLFEMASKFDIICSIGPRMKSHFTNKYRALPHPGPTHIELIPQPDQKFFDIQMKEAPKDFKGSIFRVIAVGRVKGVEKLKGYDLVAQAMGRVAESFHGMFQRPPKLIIRGIPLDESDESREFFNRHNKSPYLQVIMYPYGTQDDIRIDFQQSHLCIMASRSEPFGMVGLEAMATGIPTLVTSNSGLAELIRTDEDLRMYAHSLIVDVGYNSTPDERDVKAWEEAIRYILNNYKVAFDRAQTIKTILRESKAINKSVENFKVILRERKNRNVELTNSERDEL